MPDWGVFLIGVAITLGGVCLVVHSFVLRARMRQSLRWPSVTGEVLESEVLVFGARIPKNYDVTLRYRYEVDARTREGHQAHLYGVTTRAEAEHIVQRFPAGSRPPVYYDRANPDRAVLVPGERAQKKMHEFWMGVLVTAAGVAVAWIHLDGAVMALDRMGR